MGNPVLHPEGIIPQADTPRNVIDLINGIDTVFLLQLHPQGNKISHIQVFDNSILTVLPFANGGVAGGEAVTALPDGASLGLCR